MVIGGKQYVLKVVDFERNFSFGEYKSGSLKFNSDGLIDDR